MCQCNMRATVTRERAILGMYGRCAHISLYVTLVIYSAATVAAEILLRRVFSQIVIRTRDRRGPQVSICPNLITFNPISLTRRYPQSSDRKNHHIHPPSDYCSKNTHLPDSKNALYYPPLPILAIDQSIARMFHKLDGHLGGRLLVSSRSLFF